MAKETHEQAAHRHAAMMFETNPAAQYASVYCDGKEFLFERTGSGFRLKATRPCWSEGREFPSWDDAR